MKEIPLSSGYVALVDDVDYERVTQFKWSATVRTTNVYAYRITARPHRHAMKLHRFIMDAGPGQRVDHKDGNGLNCTRANMRFATSSQNSCNRGPKPNRSIPGVKGVHWCKLAERYVAQIKVNYKRSFIGYFDSLREAMIAYNAKASELHGEFAWLNPIPPDTEGCQ